MFTSAAIEESRIKQHANRRGNITLKKLPPLSKTMPKVISVKIIVHLTRALFSMLLLVIKQIIG